MNNKYIDLLKQQFNNRIDIREKRPGIYQLIAPFYYEDGDMMDIFIQESSSEGKLRICDYGMALMRLSYSYDIPQTGKKSLIEYLQRITLVRITATFISILIQRNFIWLFFNLPRPFRKFLI